MLVEVVLVGLEVGTEEDGLGLDYCLASSSSFRPIGSAYLEDGFDLDVKYNGIVIAGTAKIMNRMVKIIIFFFVIFKYLYLIA